MRKKGHIFTYQEAKKYDSWFEDKKNKSMHEAEKKLMIAMLKPLANTNVLDIGCGTGQNILSLVKKGLDVEAIDPSVYMIDIAKKRIGNKAKFHKGFAEALPFDDNYFNYSILFNSLEFTSNPEKALSEAFRVTKDKVFIGLINKYSIYAYLNSSTFKNAQLLSLWNIKTMSHKFLGNVPIYYKPIIKSPFFLNSANQLFKKNPFAAFIGITIIPIPKRTIKPMPLKLGDMFKSIFPNLATKN